MKELYAGHEKAVLMLSDVLGQEECEVEDVIGEGVILDVLSDIVRVNIALSEDDRTHGSVGAQVKSSARRLNVELPDGWKAEVARRVVVTWSRTEPKDMQSDLLDRAEALFEELAKRFNGMEP